MNENVVRSVQGNQIWFTSDTHFNHERILEYCPNRAYSSVEEMNEGLIEIWNSQVAPDDEVYHLGDVLFKRDYSFLPRLNGTKHLIIGNHDQFHIAKSKNADEFCNNFASMHEYNELILGPKKTMFVLMHYPLESWNKMGQGSIHLHGHCHNGLKTKMKNRMDVGIDAHPNMISLESVISTLGVK